MNLIVRCGKHTANYQGRDLSGASRGTASALVYQSAINLADYVDG